MTKPYKKPRVIISSLDTERLEQLIESLSNMSFPGKDNLEAELARAEIVEPEDIPATVVTMNSTVRFEVDSSHEEFCLTLVYPRNVDASGEKISILAPVGSALLGLRTGQRIDWQGPGDRKLRVRVVGVQYQPEAAGDFHR